MTRRLVIDDLRVFNFEADYARDLDEAWKMLDDAYFQDAIGEKGYDEIYLDHDLGCEETIRPIVSVFEECGFEGKPYPVGKFIIVTSNPVGFSWMMSALKDHYDVYDGTMIPFKILYHVWEGDMSTTYKIVRFFYEGDREVIDSGLTLDEAKSHCQDRETSSRTALGSEAIELTKLRGEWFDGYEVEEW